LCPTLWLRSVYDNRGDSNTLVNKTQYAGLTTTLTNAKNQTRIELRDARGLVRLVTDPNSKTTRFDYEPFGNLAKTTDPMGNVITVAYDDLGRRTQLKDPDLGQINYGVDALGRTWQQVSPIQRSRNQATTIDFDHLDRMIARHEPDLESRWVYGTTIPNLGRLTETYTLINGNKDYVRAEKYDSLSRPTTTTQTLSDGIYTSTLNYDAWGRAGTQAYRRNSDAEKMFYFRYNGYGYQSAVERTGLVLWQVSKHDAARRVLQASLGNGLSQKRTYNNYTGYLDTALLQTASNAIRLEEGYQYDALGNVLQRTQYWDGAGFTETFEYDSLNRLKVSTVSGQTPQSFTYDDAGNLKTKSGTGTYSYPPQGANAIRPHAVESVSGIAGSFTYDDNGNQLGGAGRSTTWTSFDMPITITKTSGTTTSSSTFVYGSEHQRTKQRKQDGSTVIYAGQQEVETDSAGQVTVKTYWPHGIGVEIDRPGQVTGLYWVHQDRLGSVVGITDQSGNSKEKLEYDAWGKRRSLDGSSIADNIDGTTDNKGFTHHEMLDQLDLVHMNGRVYDPYTARFLSGDPVVQDPVNGQNYNRYSYVLNNPTNLTDPTGFSCADSGSTDDCGGKGLSLQAFVSCSGDCSSSGGGTSSKTASKSAGAATTTDSNANNRVSAKNGGSEGGKGSANGNSANSGAKSGGVIMPFLQKLDERFAEWHGGVFPLISREKSEAAADYWQQKADETGNPLYRVPAMLANSVAEHPDEVALILSVGRSGRQARLKELSKDDKLGAADKGWLQQEMNSIERGQRASIRNPPGTELAHERGREAAKGYDYSRTQLQDRDLHKLQHKYDEFGRANKERPLDK
jgi:RHS repeat-associated protein